MPPEKTLKSTSSTKLIQIDSSMSMIMTRSSYHLPTTTRLRSNPNSKSTYLSRFIPSPKKKNKKTRRMRIGPRNFQQVSRLGVTIAATSLDPPRLIWWNDFGHMKSAFPSSFWPTWWFQALGLYSGLFVHQPGHCCYNPTNKQNLLQAMNRLFGLP